MAYFTVIFGKNRDGYAAVIDSFYWTPAGGLDALRKGLVNILESYSQKVHATVYREAQSGKRTKIGTVTVIKDNYPWTAYWTTDKGKTRITKSGALAKAPSQYGIKGKLRPFGL